MIAVSPQTATALVNLAVRCDTELPTGLDATIEGTLSRGHLRVLASVTKDVPAHVRTVVEAEAIRLAPRRTHAQLRQDLEELTARLDPDHAAAAANAGIADRGVWLKPSSKAGCKRLVADLPAPEAMATSLALDEIARYAASLGDERLRGQLRADALVGAVTGVMSTLINATTGEPASPPTDDAPAPNPVPTRDEGFADLFEVQVVTAHSDDDDGHRPADRTEPGGDGSGNRGNSDGGNSDGGNSDDGACDSPRGKEGNSDQGYGKEGDSKEGDGEEGDGEEGDGEEGDGDQPSADSHGDPPAAETPRDPLAGWTPPQPVPVPDDLVARCRTPIVVAASTLTGADDHPASLPGAGPLDADAARAIAARTRYRWLHVDPMTGYLLHREARAHPPPPSEHAWASGRPPAPPPLPETISAAMRSPGYVPGSLLRAHVEVRDATCIGPACHHPTHGSDIDHTINYGEIQGSETRDGDPTHRTDPTGRADPTRQTGPTGRADPTRQTGPTGRADPTHRTGPTGRADPTHWADPTARLGLTEASNLGPQCRRVHLSKTHGDWQLSQPTPGHFTWTSPLGRIHTRHARSVLPGWTHLVAAGPCGDAP